MAGRELSTKAEFFPGAAAIVHDPEIDWDPKKLSNKVNGNGFNFQAEHFALPFIRILGSKHVPQRDCCTFAISAL